MPTVTRLDLAAALSDVDHAATSLQQSVWASIADTAPLATQIREQLRWGNETWGQQPVWEAWQAARLHALGVQDHVRALGCLLGSEKVHVWSVLTTTRGVVDHSARLLCLTDHSRPDDRIRAWAQERLWSNGERTRAMQRRLQNPGDVPPTHLNDLRRAVEHLTTETDNWRVAMDQSGIGNAPGRRKPTAAQAALHHAVAQGGTTSPFYGPLMASSSHSDAWAMTHFMASVGEVPGQPDMVTAVHGLTTSYAGIFATLAGRCVGTAHAPLIRDSGASDHAVDVWLDALRRLDQVGNRAIDVGDDLATNQT